MPSVYFPETLPTPSHPLPSVPDPIPRLCRQKRNLRSPPTLIVTTPCHTPRTPHTHFVHPCGLCTPLKPSRPLPLPSHPCPIRYPNPIRQKRNLRSPPTLMGTPPYHTPLHHTPTSYTMGSVCSPETLPTPSHPLRGSEVYGGIP